MSVPLITEVPDPVIGKYYMVLAVFHNQWGCYAPIYGPPHEDAQFLDFEEIHWHVDWRFASRALFRLKLAFRTRQHGDPAAFLHGIVASYIHCGEPRIRKMSMKRQTPPYPPVKAIPWLKKLEDAFTFHVLPKCLTCPHKGISLKHVKPDEHGLITCPGHGLTWHSKTGLLVRGT